MKFRNIVLFFLIASLFLLLAPHRAAMSVAGTTITLSVPNLPSGG
jgi:hypothetical protein